MKKQVDASFNESDLIRDGGIRASMPEWVGPQLAQAGETPPQGDDWIHEVKFDGYRMVSFFDRKKVSLYSRNRIDWTNKFSSLHEELTSICSRTDQVILDGEVCSIDASGKSSFSLLQKSFTVSSSVPYVYFVFDLLYWNGVDCRGIPLLQRKEYLDLFLKTHISPSIHYSSHILGNVEVFLSEVRKYSWEGIISKNIHAAYVSRRAPSWQKTKCKLHEDFIVIGYTHLRGDASAKAIGALLLGYPTKQGIQYCGKVGTGFGTSEREHLYQLCLRSKIQKKTAKSMEPIAGAQWVKPRIVVEVEFTEWTPDGHLRHPAFLGIRSDKKPADVVTQAPGDA